MPLDSSKVKPNVLEYMRTIPYDDNATQELEPEEAYITKVSIYDEKCNGCGFSHIAIVTQHGIRVFHNIGKAIDFATKNSFIAMHRCCEYPNDMIILHGKPKYITLSEIVSNGCQFWNIDKLNIPPDNETIFIEKTDVVENAVV